MSESPEETPKEYIALTDEQVAALSQAQALVEATLVQAKAAVEQAEARRDALLLGIMTGAHLTSGRALRITDDHRLEIAVSPNGNGKG